VVSIRVVGRREAMKQQSLLILTLLLIVAIALPVPAVDALPITFVGSLVGANEVPTVPSPGAGSATVVLDPTAETIQVNATFSGLTSNDVAAHIHCCAPLGTNAGVATTVPAFPGFPLGVTSGTYSSAVFDLTQPTIYNPAFVTLEGGTIPQAEAALIAGIEHGMTYLNIHTTNNPGGEIRGQLEPVPEPTTLLLWGTTMAGFGIIRIRRRRQN
jgi:CHRD domain-containing protein